MYARIQRPASVVVLLFVAICSVPSSAVAAPIDNPEVPLPVDDEAPPPAAQDDAGTPSNSAGNAMRRDPRLGHSEVRLAVEAMHARDVEGCLEHLRKAAAEPAMPPEGVLLAYLHLSENRWQQAMAVLEQAAIETRGHPEVYLAAARLALAQGRNLDAQVHFERALTAELPPSWPDGAKHDLATSCFDGLATIAKRRGDWEAVAQTLTQWAKLEKNNANLLDRLGKAHFVAGNTDEAFARFANSHSLDPSMNPPELSMAALATKSSGMKGGQAWYEKAIAKYPADSRVYCEYAGALLTAGRFTDAEVQLDKAVAVDSTEQLSAADVALLRGMVYRAQKKYEQAEEQFTQVLEVTPGHFQALRQLPLVLVEQDDEAKREQAVQLATFHARRPANSPAALSTLGWVYYRTGKTKEAEELLKHATSASADGEGLYFVARVLVESGQADDAQKAVQALKDAIERPAPFLLRDEARTWVKSTALLFEQ